MPRTVAISVILPAHNVGAYLAESLDSLLAQRFRDFEVLIVENGSTDDTQAVIDRYCSRDRRFRALHSNADGVGAARNLGLDRARGKYVAFIDGDDVFTPNALSSLYRTARREDADLVVGNYVFFDELQEWRVPAMDELMLHAGIDPFDTRALQSLVVWNKLYRRSLIEQAGARFADLSHSEDAVFSARFAYACTRIATVNETIYRYRQRAFTGHLSAVQLITEKARGDINTAYREIRSSATLHLTGQADPDGEHRDSWTTKTRRYLEFVLQKEAHNLLNQHVRRTWLAQDGVIPSTARRLEEIRATVGMTTWNDIVRVFRDVRPNRIPVSIAEMTDAALVSVAIYADHENSGGFTRLVSSMAEQKFPRMKLFVPEAMRKSLPWKPGHDREIVLINADCKTDFYNAVLRDCATEFVLFTEPGFSYQSNAFHALWNAIDVSNYDFSTSPVSCAGSLGGPTVAAPQRSAFASAEMTNEAPSPDLDLLFPNKLFRVSFLEAARFGFTDDQNGDLARLYDVAYVRHLRSSVVLTEMTESELSERLFQLLPARRQERGLTEGLARARKVTRTHNLVTALTVPASDERRALASEILSWAVRFIPTRKRVFFYSSRTDGLLERNMQLVHDEIGASLGRVVAKRLPHPVRTDLRIRYLLSTSKVIVLDDYDVTYLSYMSLRRDQRVIQLWHACGALKHFGLDGGPYSYEEEVAAHRLYSAVSVSAEAVRIPYANAFGVDVERVMPLGVPRTDYYFDEAAMATAREDVYARYPRLIGKRIALYAPTFRDHQIDPTRFDSGIDFADLSASLGDDQIMVIRRHGATPDRILGRRKYANIVEIDNLTTESLMLVADVLITDYSTLIFDNWLLGKPFALYCPDLKEYNRGFYVDFPDDIPAPLLEDYPALRAYLAKGDYRMDRERLASFMENQVAACDGQSTQRVVALMKRYLNE